MMNTDIMKDNVENIISEDTQVLTIKQLRTLCSMTQQEFANFLQIPKRTIGNWETGTRKAPDYVRRLIEYMLRNEGLI